MDRRSLLVAAGASLSLMAFPAAARSSSISGTQSSPGPSFTADGSGDQTGALQRLLDRAGESDTPVFLQPGAYRLSGLRLARRTRLIGVAGATRLILDGDAPLLSAVDADHVELRGLTLDGAERPLAGIGGLLDLRRVRHAVIEDCRVDAAASHGLYLERVGGRIAHNAISGAGEAGIFCVDAAGMQIVGNSVADCGNGGILVHRWEKGHDGTFVTSNRVSRIRADHGGTGQFGNGINTYRAAGVMIAGNIVEDCAFSAIRANGSGNITINGNQCLRSGETALYAEFDFEGAVISANTVDGGANGISVVNFNEGGRMAVCSGNIVRNLSEQGPYPADPPGFGVGITVEADTTVIGNVVENAPRYGLHIGWGPFMRNVVASGNVVRNAAEGIAVSVVEGTGKAVISDNLIEGTTRGAIVGHRWSDAATGDLSLGGADDFPNLVVERNRVS